eukprot:scaffold3721_cov134-Isochrysis_galbana.AAC.12
MVDLGCHAGHGVGKNVSDALLFLRGRRADAFEAFVLDVLHRLRVREVPPYARMGVNATDAGHRGGCGVGGRLAAVERLSAGPARMAGAKARVRCRATAGAQSELRMEPNASIWYFPLAKVGAPFRPTRYHARLRTIFIQDVVLLDASQPEPRALPAAGRRQGRVPPVQNSPVQIPNGPLASAAFSGIVGVHVVTWWTCGRRCAPCGGSMGGVVL